MKLIKNTVGALHTRNSQHDQAKLPYVVCVCGFVDLRERKEKKMVFSFWLSSIEHSHFRDKGVMGLWERTVDRPQIKRRCFAWQPHSALSLLPFITTILSFLLSFLAVPPTPPLPYFFRFVPTLSPSTGTCWQLSAQKNEWHCGSCLNGEPFPRQPEHRQVARKKTTTKRERNGRSSVPLLSLKWNFFHTYLHWKNGTLKMLLSLSALSLFLCVDEGERNCCLCYGGAVLF